MFVLHAVTLVIALLAMAAPCRGVEKEGSIQSFGPMTRSDRSLPCETQKSHQSTRDDRDRLIFAIHAVERALASAAPNRERAWLRAVLKAMRLLESAMQQQCVNADSPLSLLAEIINDAPHLYPRVERLKREYRDLLRQISELLDQFEGGLGVEETPNYVDLRQRLAWLLTALRHQQSRETDLIFEAVDTDLGALD
jgi:hypothetical protein